MLDDGRALAAGPDLPHQRRSTAERAVVLRALPVFNGIDDEAVALLADNAVDCMFEADEVLMAEGRPTEHLHIVLGGRVDVSRNGVQTASVGRPGGVGFITLLGDDPHGITAIAVEPTETMRFSRDVIREVYHESFTLLRNNLRITARFILQLRGDLPRPKGSDPNVALGEKRDHALTLVERLLEVRRGIFGDVNLDAAIGIARASREVRFAPGDVMWEIGDPSDFSYFIRYGRVRCENAAGESVMVGGDFALGTMDLVGAQPHRFSATCETEVIGFQLDREPFLAVLESHYDLAMGFVATLSRTLVAAQPQPQQEGEALGKEE